MKKIWILTFLILSIGVVLDSDARDRHIDNKSLCEKTKGVWRAFNNNCADICDSKFEYLPCTSVPIMTCECGEKRCWDGGKCISEKLAKEIWDKKNEPLIEVRKQELKELEEKRIEIGLSAKPPIFDPEIHGQEALDSNDDKIANDYSAPKKPVLNNLSSQISNLAQPIGNNPKKLPPVRAISGSSQDQNSNLEERRTCESQNGSWKLFNNGCVDSCASQASSVSMCTQSLKKGCECGASKCWDGATKTCVVLEEYKLSQQAQKNNESIKSGIDDAAKLFDSIPFPTIPNLNK